MNTTTHTKRGFALPAAIGGLVIVGILATGGFYMARQEVRVGVASRHASLAVNLAQSAANDVLISQTSSMAGLNTWDTLTLVDTVAQGITRVQVTRLATRLYYLDAEAEVTLGGALWAGATRRIGLVARMNTADIEPPAALTTQGVLKYGGSSEIHGLDRIPNGSDGYADWTSFCNAGDLGDKPGILIDDTTNIDWNGNRNKIENQMDGVPLFDQDTTISTESLTTFGDMDWEDMVGLADKIYNSSGNPGMIAPIVDTDGNCAQSVKNNWGDPLNPAGPCFNYFPIIYINNSSEITLNTGFGQGILLIEGDVRVNGGFEFYGPVFIKGKLTTNGSGGHFWGGVVAANVSLETTTVLGNAVINYSSCAVERALLNNSSLTKVRPIAMRSWVDLSNVTN
ncbi:MAG: hypothetical protein RH859_07200 [Longimicrobiales bacterium]